MSLLRELTSELTVLEEKRDDMLMDTDYRVGAEEALHALSETPVSRLHEIALVLIKPDAIATGQAEGIVRALESAGARVIAAGVTPVDSARVRALWRAQFRFASRERVELTEELFALGPSILILLDDRHSNGEAPLAVRLAELKGRPHPDEREAHHLRSRLASPNRFFSLFHVADEPVDVIRELAILVPPAELRSLLSTAIVGVTASSALDVNAAVARASEVLQRRSQVRLPLSFEPHARCVEAVDAIASEQVCRAPFCMRCVLSEAKRGPLPHHWCLLLAAAERIDRFNRDVGYTPPMRAASRDWERRWIKQ